jgi:Ca2+-binding EF-hand superfamily protein
VTPTGMADKPSPEETKALFDMFDIEGKGLITQDGLSYVMEHLCVQFSSVHPPPPPFVSTSNAAL